jgi:hypothetical protein
MNDLHRELTIFFVEKFSDEWAREYVGPAFRGNPDAAGFLASSLSNAKRGHVAVAMWEAKVPRDAFREYLAAVWTHDHAELIVAAGKRRLAAMFRYAAFPMPEEINGTVRVWRGTSGITAKQARCGYSWTINRDVACWFAMRFAKQKGNPLVLSAQVTKEEIAFYENDYEQEVLILTAPKTCEIDGDEEDWIRCASRQQEEIRKENSLTVEANKLEYQGYAEVEKAKK